MNLSTLCSKFFCWPITPPASDYSFSATSDKILLNSCTTKATNIKDYQLETPSLRNTITSHSHSNLYTTELPDVTIADLTRFISDDTFHLNLDFKSRAPSKPVLLPSYGQNTRLFIHTQRPCTPLCCVYNPDPTLKCRPFKIDNCTEITKKHIAQNTFRIQKKIFFGWTIFCCCSKWDKTLNHWVGDHFQVANNLPLNTNFTKVSGSQSSIAYYIAYTFKSCHLFKTQIPSLFHLSMSSIVHNELYLYHNLRTVLPTKLYQQIPPVYVECLRPNCYFDRRIISCFTG